jgi:Ni,Fe-hydrogenase maturation factor
MKVYVFGNKDSPLDKTAFSVADRLNAVFPQIDFVEVGINTDLPFASKDPIVIMDTVDGIDKVELIENSSLNRLINKRSSSVHDFDLGFQLKYLKKLGKLGNVTIIGIPMKKRTNYLRIQSILRKLVAQDMQGS